MARVPVHRRLLAWTFTDATCPAPNVDAISALEMDNCANCLLNFIIVITPIANIQYTVIVMKHFKYDMRLLLKVCKKKAKRHLSPYLLNAYDTLTAL